MPGVSRLGDSAMGHEGFPPSPSIQGSSNVFVNSLPTARVTDSVAPHPHPRNVLKGSSTVFVNSLAIARLGDAISCGGFFIQGSGNVISG